MSQRRSFSHSHSSNDFNLDDLFRPEPGQEQGQAAPQPAAPQMPPAAPPVPGQGGPEYWGAAPAPQGAQPVAEHAPETQYLPPYPTADPAVGGGAPQQMPGQPTAGQSGYPAGQSYGGQQTFGGQQSYGGQQTFGGQQQPYGGQQPQQSYGGQQTFGGQSFPAAPAGPAHPGAGQGRGGSGRPSNRLVVGGAIAGVAVVGILVAVLMSGGDDKPSGAKPPAAAASHGATASAAGGTDPAVQAQASALSDLLGTASASRQAVVGAVSAVTGCQKLPESQAQLTDAAGQRQALLTKLAALKVDKLPSGPELAGQLQKAWQASATADSEYAAWAGDLAAGCDAGTAKNNQHYKDGTAASGTATGAKEKASSLWNSIAGQTGLPTRGKTDL